MPVLKAQMSYVHIMDIQPLYICDFLENRFCGHSTFLLQTVDIMLLIWLECCIVNTTSIVFYSCDVFISILLAWGLWLMPRHATPLSVTQVMNVLIRRLLTTRLFSLSPSVYLSSTIPACQVVNSHLVCDHDSWPIQPTIATTDIQEAIVARLATSWHQKSMEA